MCACMCGAWIWLCMCSSVCGMCVTVCMWVWLCVCSVCLVYVCVCGIGSCVWLCVCDYVCSLCVWCVLTHAGEAIQVMEASCSVTKQIAFLSILQTLLELWEGSLSPLWRGRSFQINIVCKDDRFLGWISIWVPVYCKFLRKLCENIVFAQNAAVRMCEKMEEITWVLTLCRCCIMSFSRPFFFFGGSGSGYICSVSFPGQRTLAPLSSGFLSWTITHHSRYCLLSIYIS
jgi:hypothetical protein